MSEMALREDCGVSCGLCMACLARERREERVDEVLGVGVAKRANTPSAGRISSDRSNGVFPPLTPQERLDLDEWHKEEPIDIPALGRVMMFLAVFWGVVAVMFLSGCANPIDAIGRDGADLQPSTEKRGLSAGKPDKIGPGVTTWSNGDGTLGAVSCCMADPLGAGGPF